MYGAEDALATRHAKGCMLDLSGYFWDLLSEMFCRFRIDLIILQI